MSLKAGNQAESLPAKVFMTAVKTVGMPFESAIEPDHRAAEAAAANVPEPRNPVAIGHVAGCPDVSRSWAGRNVSHRSAHINPKLGCLRRCRSNGRNASHHRRTQHPLAHAAHNPSPSARLRKSRVRPGFFPLGACLLLPLRCAGYVLIQHRLQEKVAV